MKCKHLLASFLALLMLGQPLLGMTSVMASETSEVSNESSLDQNPELEETIQVDNGGADNGQEETNRAGSSQASQPTNPQAEASSQSHASSASSSSASSSASKASSQSSSASSKAEDKLLDGQDILLVIDDELFSGNSEEARLMSQQSKEIVNHLTSNMSDQNRMMVAYTFYNYGTDHCVIVPTYADIDNNSPAAVQKELDMLWQDNRSHAKNQSPIDQYRQLSNHSKNLQVILLTRGNTRTGLINPYLNFSKNANIKGVETDVTAVQFAVRGKDKQGDDNFDKNISAVYKNYVNQGVEPVVIDPYQYASQREGYLQAILSDVYGSDFTITAGAQSTNKKKESGSSTKQSGQDQTSQGSGESQDNPAGHQDEGDESSTNDENSQASGDQSNDGGSFIDKLIFEDNSETTTNNQDKKSWFFYDDDSTTNNSFGDRIYNFITEPVEDESQGNSGGSSYYKTDNRHPNKKNDDSLPHTGTRRVRKEVYIVAIILLAGGGYLIYRKKAGKADQE
ncbi:hypothetical protein AWM75_05470 [Aerococcus urinaehominis]|uniref:Uncharacterized protein n=1 Tax=Aerococcus urinaehominis TaxID=128944 RepID=A0A0X8FLL2_9LACT|nr:hypothetical protein [Aerococcus urinaehominis]AMB99477.1 hypothetical protein AWM75_05470 [Aerococcus urinaehominis]SDM27064.1 hypothetical protein SAMN04487985_11051 [Aerococcus urinaehominis]